MNSFFNEESANIIQFISFFLEFTGLYLAYISIFNQKKVHNLEHRINNIHQGILIAFDLTGDKNTKSNKMTSFLVFILATLDAIITINIYSFFNVNLLVNNISEDYNIILNILSMIIIYAIVVVSMIIFIMLMSHLTKVVIKYFKKKSPDGYAYVFLGLFIAMLGLIGECYQIITILVN